ncbi:hypothetical protein E4U56_004656, partial [Claviceps arundinis]
MDRSELPAEVGIEEEKVPPNLRQLLGRVEEAISQTKVSDHCSIVFVVEADVKSATDFSLIVDLSFPLEYKPFAVTSGFRTGGTETT